jgi:hypothetical protein
LNSNNKYKKEKLINNSINKNIIKKVDNKNINNLTFNLKNSDIGKCIYVDYHSKDFITKYNDIYNFLKNNQFFLKNIIKNKIKVIKKLLKSV